MPRIAIAVSTVVAAAVTCGALLEARQSAEEIARRQYQTGIDFLREAKFTEALRDFQAVVDAYPSTTVADDALLEIARYQLTVARNLDAAQSAVTQLHKQYATSDAAPAAYVLSGQIRLARGRQPADIEQALADFQRVPKIFPGSDAVPAAMLAGAETLRIAGRCADALEQFTQVAANAREAWTRASSAEGATLSEHGGRIPDLAKQELQALRAQ